MDKWIYMEYVYNGMIYSYKKRGNATIYDNTDGFKYTILNEMFQEEENKYCMVSPLCEI